MRNVVLFLVTGLMLMACGREVPPHTVQVCYDESVPDDQQEMMQDDLINLALIQGGKARTEQDRQTFGTTAFDGVALSNLLGDGMKFIVGEDYDKDANVFVTEENVVYRAERLSQRFFSLSPSPSLPRSTTPARLNNASERPDPWLPRTGATIIMNNLLAAFYLAGKENNVLYTMRACEQDFTVRSPTDGGFQIGPGLFSRRLPVEDSEEDSLANSILRLSTYFHERGHNLGNGNHTGFPHARCPEGHDLENEFACDRYSNGPYTDGAILIESFLQQPQNVCIDCDEETGLPSERELSEEEVSALRLAALDSRDRVLDNAVFRDPTPEGIPNG